MSSDAHLLSCIQQAADGLSLSELLNKAPTLPRRSAQRLIAQLLEGGQIRAQGQARARRYFVVQPQAASYAKTITSDAFPSFIPLSSDSQDVLAYINQPLEARKPVGYQRDFLDSYRPNKTWYLPAHLAPPIASDG